MDCYFEGEYPVKSLKRPHRRAADKIKTMPIPMYKKLREPIKKPVGQIRDCEKHNFIIPKKF